MSQFQNSPQSSNDLDCSRHIHQQSNIKSPEKTRCVKEEERKGGRINSAAKA